MVNSILSPGVYRNMPIASTIFLYLWFAMEIVFVLMSCRLAREIVNEYLHDHLASLSLY